MSLAGRCVAEFLGTFLLIFFGCGAVHVAMLTGALNGLWQVAIVWGVAIMVAVFVTAAISGAHINPAITMSMVLWRGFPPSLVLPYVISQLAGAFLAAAALFFLFTPFLNEKEKNLGLIRGRPGSEITAMCYCEYYPNPGRLEGLLEDADKSREEIFIEHASLIGEGTAFFAEFLGTMILALVVFAVTDERNFAGPGQFAPVFIGLTVSILISVLAPLTQACFNPARDFGPRLFAYLAGWDEIAIPGPNGRGFWTVYIVAPVLGAIAGGAMFKCLLRRHLPEPEGNKA